MTNFLWQECLKHLRQVIPKKQFTCYINPLQIKLTKKHLLILIPNYYIMDKITTYYISIIKHTIYNISHKIYNIKLKIGTTISNTSLLKNQTHTNSLHNINNLNTNQTFDNFIFGTINTFIKLTILTMLENPGKIHNPLFLYGKTGTGKTHLINAISNNIFKKNPHIKIILTNAKLLNHNITSFIQKKNTSKLENHYKTCNILIIDDIHFLTKKTKTQEKFNHILDILIKKQQQIILTSNKKIENILTIKEKLKSNISNGLTIKIITPELISRIQISKNIINFLKIKIHDDVIIYIAKNINTNIKLLENTLKYLSIKIYPTKNITSLKLVKILLKEHLDKNLSITKIIKTVSKFYNIDNKMINSKKRYQSIITTRQIIIFLCKNLTTYSLSEIGYKIGNYNYTTVLHSYKKIHKLINNNKLISQDIAYLTTLLLG